MRNNFDRFDKSVPADSINKLILNSAALMGLNVFDLSRRFTVRYDRVSLYIDGTKKGQLVKKMALVYLRPTGSTN